MTAAGAQRGFSLFEMAIVITIVGLLLALSAEFMGGYTERQQYKAASDKLSAIEQALVRYLSVTGHLPCPDTDLVDGDRDGNEDRATASSCDASVGTVPWIELGITPETATDVRGNLIGYAVMDDLADSGTNWRTRITAHADVAGLGFEVQESGTPIMRPNAATMPTGAAFVLMANSWYDDPTTGADDTLADTLNGAGDKINLHASAISELVRRPTVAEMAQKVDLP
ncbi:type II secretion system protein [Caenispirillum salinarum]|uniref:type II secretion system protein n=1 Tax=Caenispirillum salinarum TaxID=859058 RepID=UPI00384DB18B